MKDENDTKTADLLVDGRALALHQQVSDTIARKIGRPRVHESGAARQKAYRSRQKKTGKRVTARYVVAASAGDTQVTSKIIAIPVLYRSRTRPD